MDPRKVAAHFTAFVWFSKRNPETQGGAGRFADDNWRAFLPLAHESLGRLLVKDTERLVEAKMSCTGRCVRRAAWSRGSPFSFPRGDGPAPKSGGEEGPKKPA